MKHVSPEELLPAQVTLGERGSRWMMFAVVAAVVGWVATGILATTMEGGADRFFRSYLVNFMYFLSIGLGALFFVLITHLTRAGWSVALRRLAEVLSLTLIPLGGLALVVYFGRHDLYEWTHADVMATDELLKQKKPYLNSTFFLIRIVGYFVIWSLMAMYFASRSRRQDESGDPNITLGMERVAAPGTIVYALTVTFAAFDFMMSLYPHWYSTIYGVYFFAGCVLSCFALISLIVMMLQSSGRLSGMVTSEHFHDLGKLMFAFVVFWAYIAFSQFMLIWYAHIPEETQFYLTRQEGPWVGISLLLVFGHFFVPFLWLISRHPKRRGFTLGAAAVWLLFIHWIDIFWLVIPESVPHGQPFHLLDLTILLGIGGIFFAAAFWRLGRAHIVPMRDPRLAESLSLENV